MRCRRKSKGQVLMEFAFSMIIILFIIFGLIMVFRWTGLDLAERRRAHDTVLMGTIIEDYGNVIDGPLKQIDPFFYNPIEMNAVHSLAF